MAGAVAALSPDLLVRAHPAITTDHRRTASLPLARGPCLPLAVPAIHGSATAAVARGPAAVSREHLPGRLGRARGRPRWTGEAADVSRPGRRGGKAGVS